MVIKQQDILTRIDTDFTKTYKPFSNFKGSGAMWQACIDTVNNQELMNHMIFVNDKLELPPVKVFLAVNKQFQNLSPMDKKALGAFWGFVFKFVFEYKEQRSTIINCNGVKTATYFYGNSSAVKVI